jgi:uncharacterized membrane protein YjfL (UPF0719 family)
MDVKYAVLSLCQLVLAMLMGVLVLFISYKIIKSNIIKKYHIGQDNVAFAILCAGMLLSVGNLMEGMMTPMGNAIQQLSMIQEDFLPVLAKSMMYIGLFAGVGLVLSLLVNVVSIKLFVALTDVDEFQEIAHNNVAIGLITATIVLVISLFVKQPAVQLMEAIVPYPSLPNVL